MKKSIFKRIVSAALALTMLASMAVGMSTSASAATNAKPGAIGKMWFEKCANSNYVKLRWTPAANATRYTVRIIDTESKDYHGNVQCRTYECNSSSTWQNLYATKKDLLSSRYDISVTSYNGAGEGPTSKPYEFQGYEDWYRPYMLEKPEMYKKVTILSKTSAKVTFTLKEKGLEIITEKNVEKTEHLNQGYCISLEEFGSGKTKCAVTGCASSKNKSCTVSRLDPGRSYIVYYYPYAYGYNHTCIYGEREYLGWFTAE